MAEPVVPVTPFEGLAPIEAGSGALTIAARPALGKLTLRGNLRDAAFAAATARVLGTALPATPGDAVERRPLCSLCPAPDEWLIVGEEGAALPLAALRGALDGVFCAVVDVGSAFATLRAGGPRAPELLRKVCSVDLTRAGERACWQTRLGPYAVLVHRRAPAVFDLHVARSYARSFWDWVADAAVEFDVDGAVAGRVRP